MASFNTKFANNPSPYKLVLSEEESYYQNHYFKLAMEVAKYDLTYESFGLTLIDLLQFDIPTFKLIRTAVEDKVAERAKHIEEIAMESYLVSENMKSNVSFYVMSTMKQ